MISRGGHRWDAVFAVVTLASACSPTGENATPKQMCERGKKLSESAPGPKPTHTIAGFAEECARQYEELKTSNPEGFACVRRCMFSSEDPEVYRNCSGLCTPDIKTVCDGLRQQANGPSPEELPARTATCLDRRNRLRTDRAADFACPAKCVAASNEGVPGIERCWDTCK